MCYTMLMVIAEGIGDRGKRRGKREIHSIHFALLTLTYTYTFSSPFHQAKAYLADPSAFAAAAPAATEAVAEEAPAAAKEEEKKEEAEESDDDMGFGLFD